MTDGGEVRRRRDPDSGHGDSDAHRRDPDRLVARAGRGDPDRDQHFLVDDRVLDRLPAHAESAGFDLAHVLEIGAGAGGLTDRLLAVSGRVTAVERDPDLADFLRTEFADEIGADRLTVIEGDALAVELPDFSACIANLPYGVSSEIAFRLLPLGKPLLLTFQREFAERMVAEAGTPEYGRLSVTAGHYADAEIVELVPKEAFDPQPAVESAVVRLLPREPDYEVRVAATSPRDAEVDATDLPPDEAFFLRFVKALFTQRRKTVRNAIRNTAHISGLDDPEAVVAETDEALLAKRPGDLEPSAFATLARTALERGLDAGEETDADAETAGGER